MPKSLAGARGGQLAAIHYGTLHSIPTAELERWLGREISRDEYLAAERRQDASRDAARERAAWRRLEAEPKIGATRQEHRTWGATGCPQPVPRRPGCF